MAGTMPDSAVSVAMPAYNEEEAVGDVVAAFQALDPVDEVVVADNNSTDETVAEAEAAGATVVHEPQQGYGHALKRALSAADGDIVISVESDGSFHAEDLFKLLAYAPDFDVVYGTRTNRSMIEPAAKMGWFLRFGNKMLGRATQLGLDGARITDVGCSLRLFHREALDAILNDPVEEPVYSLQLIAGALKREFDIVQIPVHYCERTGESKLTNSFRNSLYIGLRMFLYALRETARYRLPGGRAK